MGTRKNELIWETNAYTLASIVTIFPPAIICIPISVIYSEAMAWVLGFILYYIFSCFTITNNRLYSDKIEIFYPTRIIKKKQVFENIEILKIKHISARSSTNFVVFFKINGKELHKPLPISYKWLNIKKRRILKKRFENYGIKVEGMD